MATKVSKSHKSVKHDIIDKSYSKILVFVALAVFIVVFSIFASVALINQGSFHGRVISEKEKARDQLVENVETLDELKQEYNNFASTSVNILGGDASGDGSLDGDNVSLVLDALPSKYDYVALSSSFEKILVDGGYNIESIGGTDELARIDESSNASSTGQYLELPYTFSFSSSAERTQDLIETLEKSIRPMYIEDLKIEVGGKTLQTDVTLKTYYTERTRFNLGSKEVK